MFKPMLAPNKQPDFDAITYPVIASRKMDGIRSVFRSGEMLSRSLKSIQNSNLQNLFTALKNDTMALRLIFDGELYSPNMTFQEITSCVMSRYKGIPEHLKFHCFDAISPNLLSQPFSQRIKTLNAVSIMHYDHVHIVEQVLIANSTELMDMYNDSIDEGYEGLILRHPDSPYKCGRCTMKEGYMYKMKPMEEFIGTVKGIVQATRVDEQAVKTVNELGRSVTSKKKGDRIPIPMAAAFLTEHEGHDVKVTIGGTEAFRKHIWEFKDDYIGGRIKYKGMLIGSKDVPRHPILVAVM